MGGNDTLNGGSGNDILYGDAANYSGDGFVFMDEYAGGTDTLNGGAGNDQLWGGPNDDPFVFNVGSGNDVIHDFNQANSQLPITATEHDIINVQAYGFSDWNALNSVISDNGSGNAVIQLSATDSVELIGVQTANLNQNDFII